MRIMKVGCIALLATMSVCTLLSINTAYEIKDSIDKKNTPTNIVNSFNTYDNNDELVETIKNEFEDDFQNIQEGLAIQSQQLEQIKEEPEVAKDEVVSIGVNDYGVVYNTQHQLVRDPWKGPRSYKCNKAAGYPAICGYCGEQGEIHHNIKEWQDTQGTYHLTHVGCGKLYCDTLGVEPRLEESYKVR